MNKDEQPICQINEFGTKHWILDNRYHCLDGPALEYANGDKLWFLHGELHRLDGPAEEYINGYKKWWYHGEQISCSSQEEFKRLIKLKALW